jgi:SAM-dependent methyltransferase
VHIREVHVADDPLAFVGTVPENYDRLLGPMLFEPYARDVAARVPWRSGIRVLELACGTGRVTKHLAEHLHGSERLTATDLNADMIKWARSVVGEKDGLEWQTADAGQLPFDDSTFDVVVCQFGLMFVPDKQACLRETHRVLESGGRLLVTVWDGFEHNRAAALVQATLRKLFPQDPPTTLLVPYSMDRAQLRALADAAGYAEVSVHELALAGESPTAHDAATGFTHGTPLFASLSSRGAGRLEETRDAVAAAFAAELGDRPMRSPQQALVLDARRP